MKRFTELRQYLLMSRLRSVPEGNLYRKYIKVKNLFEDFPSLLECIEEDYSARNTLSNARRLFAEKRTKLVNEIDKVKNAN